MSYFQPGTDNGADEYRKYKYYQTCRCLIGRSACVGGNVFPIGAHTKNLPEKTERAQLDPLVFPKGKNGRNDCCIKAEGVCAKI